MEKKKKIATSASAKVYGSDEVTRYLGALSEEFQGRVAGIGEQFGGLNRRFDEVGKRFDFVDRRFAQADKQSVLVNKKLDAHTEMIGTLAEDVAIIKTNIELLKSAVAAKVDYQDFAALEKRMRIVEAKLHR